MSDVEDASTNCTHGCSKRTRLIIGEVRDGITAITATAANRGDGINDQLMGDLRRRHEVQVWFLHVTTHGERAGKDPPVGDRCAAHQPGRCGNRWGDGGGRFPADQAGDEQVIEPTAGPRVKPAQASTPAATGMATICSPRPSPGSGASCGCWPATAE